jgi:hypothetical protein
MMEWWMMDIPVLVEVLALLEVGLPALSMVGVHLVLG